MHTFFRLAKSSRSDRKQGSEMDPHQEKKNARHFQADLQRR